MRFIQKKNPYVIGLMLQQLGLDKLKVTHTAACVQIALSARAE
jgi:hypothetical protein